MSCFLSLVWSVELRGERNHYGIYVHTQVAVIFVQSLCEFLAALSSSVCHQRSGVGCRAYHYNAFVCNLGVGIGIDAVLVSRYLFGRCVGTGSFRFCAVISGMERYGLVATHVEAKKVAYPHRGTHQLVAIRLRVAEPACQFARIAVVGQFVGAEFRHLC